MNFRERKESRAFTIVELLVVIVVIGILAAITIVSYSGISSKAIAVSLTSDLDSDAKLLQLYRVDNGVFPTTLDTEYCPKTPTVDNRYCLKASSGNTLTYSGGGQSFELTNTHSATSQSYKITEDGTIAEVVSSGASSSVSFLNSWGGVSGDWGNAIIQDDDGSYVIVGSCFQNDDNDGLISKYSADGSVLWSKDIGGFGGSEEIYSVTKTSDGGYLVAGHTSATDFLLIKFSSNGNLLWDKVWGWRRY